MYARTHEPCEHIGRSFARDVLGVAWRPIEAGGYSHSCTLRRDAHGICDALGFRMFRKLTQSGAATRFTRFDATRMVARRSGGMEIWPPSVLLVDDDYEVRSSFAAMLRADRCEVVEVDCTMELLDRLASYAFFCSESPPPDLVVCSAGLPGFSEAEVVEALSELRSHTPVVLLAVDGDAIPELRRIGPSCVLASPVDVSELRKVVLDLMPDDAWLRGSAFS